MGILNGRGVLFNTGHADQMKLVLKAVSYGYDVANNGHFYKFKRGDEQVKEVSALLNLLSIRHTIRYGVDLDYIYTHDEDTEPTFSRLMSLIEKD